jgi:hypothetical protein
MSLALSETFASRKQPKAYKHRPEDLPVLQWMLRTGYAEENLGGQFDEIMDFTAILLVREHHDRSCLRMVEEMIFTRYRKGQYIYDAEWALFESRDPGCLALVARRLRSPDSADVELARRMLRFIPCFEADEAGPEKQYRCAMRWIGRNRPRLRYTGEGSLKGNPRRFEIADETDAASPPASIVPAGCA